LPTIFVSVHKTQQESTLHRLRADFHVLCTRVAVLEYIRVCITCQRNKSKHLHLTGLL
jgi:hypothetical protein